MRHLVRPLALATAALLATACSAHQEKTAERATSPLIGTWTRSGNVPQGGGDGPQFTKLTFRADGNLAASYVAGGVGAALGASPSVKSENDTYTTSGDDGLHIAEGSRRLDYRYRVDGSTLYLTASGASSAARFDKAG